MKTRSIPIVKIAMAIAIACLLATSTSAQTQGTDWKALNEEVADLDRAQEDDRAVVVAKKALEVAEKDDGPGHPRLALNLQNLALLYKDQGRYVEAESLCKRSLAIREKALGPDHPDVALSLNKLAALYFSWGRYAEAEPLYERSLTLWEKIRGPDHLSVAVGRATSPSSITLGVSMQSPSPAIGAPLRSERRRSDRSTRTWRSRWTTLQCCIERRERQKKPRNWRNVQKRSNPIRESLK